MNAHELARRIEHWAKAYGFAGHLNLRRTWDRYLIEIEIKTTKTRASSIVTRLRLLVNEIAEGSEIHVSKKLMSVPAKDRASISWWLIYASVPIKVRKHYIQLPGHMALTLSERNKLP